MGICIGQNELQHQRLVHRDMDHRRFIQPARRRILVGAGPDFLLLAADAQIDPGVFGQQARRSDEQHADREPPRAACRAQWNPPSVDDQPRRQNEKANRDRSPLD